MFIVVMVYSQSKQKSQAADSDDDEDFSGLTETSTFSEITSAEGSDVAGLVNISGNKVGVFSLTCFNNFALMQIIYACFCNLMYYFCTIFNYYLSFEFNVRYMTSI